MTQLHPLPRQPGVWPRPKARFPQLPACGPADDRAAASAPPTMGARKCPGRLRVRGGATWCPREVPRPKFRKGTNRRGRSVEEVKHPEGV